MQKKDESLLCQIKVKPMLLEKIKASQRQDERLKEILNNSNSELGKKDFRKGNDDIVRFRNRICVPSDIEIKKEILSDAHSSSFSVHPGSTKMYKDLKQHFLWPKMKREIAEWVAKCLVCQEVKQSIKGREDYYKHYLSLNGSGSTSPWISY